MKRSFSLCLRSSTEPEGIFWITERSSTMRTYMIPRNHIRNTVDADGIFDSGVYVLVGEKDGKPMIYAGQTREGITRLISHDINKPWWTKAIMFLSDPRTFSIGFITGLERRIIKHLGTLEGVIIDNHSIPNLPAECDEAEIEDFWMRICFMLKLLGYEWVINGRPEHHDTNTASSSDGTDHSFSTHMKRGRWSLMEYGLSVGDELVFIPDESIVVTVRNGKEVEWRGAPYSLSGLAQKLLNKNALQGPLFFSYQGRKLTDIRKDIEMNAEKKSPNNRS